MNCKEAQSLFVFYLDRELDALELRSLQEHLAGCPSCREEVAALAAARTSTRQVLQHLAATAEPSPLAWKRLQARLVKEALPSRSWLSVWLSRLAPVRKTTLVHAFQGVKPMQKRLFATGLVALLAISLAVVLLVRGTTPVSAKLILERASAAQSAANLAQGIVHIRVDSVQNPQAKAGAGASTSTTAESYTDLSAGYIRSTVVDTATGRVLNAFAYDGTYTYSAEQTDTNPSGALLNIYRLAQRPDKLANDTLNHTDPAASAKQMFDTFRSDPNVQLKAQQTLPDGRSVYVLTAQESTKVMAGNTVEVSSATTTMTFDARTYELVEVQTEAHKGDQPVVVVSQRYTANEILPAGTKVAWNLSDLPSVKIVDDPNGLQGEALPEKISQDQLNANATNAYVMANPPAGFTQEISAAPNQPANQPYQYVVSYRNADGDYVVIQPAAEDMKGMYKQNVTETYTTKSGLKLLFQTETQAVQGRQLVSAFVVAPDGATFLLNSTLPMERLKALAEDLIRSNT